MSEELLEYGRELPLGWALACIGDLISSDGLFVDGDWVETKDQDPAGDVRLIQLADIGDGVFLDRSRRFLSSETARRLKCTMLQEGDILVARMPDPLGRACIFPGDRRPCVTVVDVCIIRTASAVDHRWLAWALNAPPIRARIAAMESGSTRGRISRKNLGTIPIPIPPPAEQLHIVYKVEAQISRLVAASETLRMARDKSALYKAAVLKAACEGRLVPTEAELARVEGRSNHREGLRQPAPCLQNTYSVLPEGWKWVTLSQLGELSRGQSKHRPRNDPSLFGGPYPFIQTGDIRHSKGYVRRFTQSYNEKGLAQSRLWPAGTLCITIAANIADTGILAFAACFPDSVVGFLHDGDPATTRYVELFLRTEKSKLERLAPATAQKNINLDTLSKIEIPLPPLEEQKRIVAEVDRRLSSLGVIEATVNASLRRAHSLYQAILKHAFEGKLGHQNPSDEPASALLEGIRQERSQQSGPESRRGRSPKPVPTAAQEYRLSGAGESVVGPAPGAHAPGSSLPPLRGSHSKETAAEVPESGPGFVEISRNEQIDAVWEALWGRGTLEKDEAVRVGAEDLRARGMARFQRLRRDGHLYEAIQKAIEAGVRAGAFDRPARGEVRAVLRDPRDYTAETWQQCLMGVLDHQALDQDEALRGAAEWARENLGLEFARLREDGVILGGLREALKKALRRRILVKGRRGFIQRAGE